MLSNKLISIIPPMASPVQPQKENRMPSSAIPISKYLASLSLRGGKCTGMCSRLSREPPRVSIMN